MSNTDANANLVLLVDDDEFLLNMYSKKFEQEGFEVVTKTNANEALQYLRNNEAPSICLFDVIMPEIDGLDMLETVRDEGLAENSTIIMLTNQGGDKHIDRAKELGVSGYIVKATSIPSEVVTKAKELAAGD